MSILPREVWTNPGLTIGREVRVFDELPSTNDYAAAIAHDLGNHGVVVLAEHQSAGRGQHGRVWQAMAGTSLLFSIILPPVKELHRPALLTAWAAVNVSGAIRDLTNIEATLKWPNDLLIGGKKICGILIEQGRGTVVGIGLNLNQTEEQFDLGGLPDATSLRMLTQKHHSLRTVLDAVLLRLNEDHARLLAGDSRSLEEAWVERIGLLGKAVVADRTDGTSFGGQLIEMSFEVIAIAQTNGEISVLVPETIRHLKAA